MLKTRGVDPIIIDLIAVSKDITVDRVGNCKVNEAKVGAKSANSISHDKIKGKNLAKTLAQSFRSGFLIHRAR